MEVDRDTRVCERDRATWEGARESERAKAVGREGGRERARGTDGRGRERERELEINHPNLYLYTSSRFWIRYLIPVSLL